MRSCFALMLSLFFLACGSSAPDHPRCDGSNCAGCCTAEGQCLAGTESTACGVVGMLCVSCPADQACNASGRCQRCDASTCPNGCCDEQNNCQPGTASAACGDSGEKCSQCGGALYPGTYCYSLDADTRYCAK